MKAQTKKLLAALAGLLCAFALVGAVFASPSYAEEPASLDVSAQIAELIAAGDPDATVTIASDLSSPDEADAYLEGLTEDEQRYAAVGGGLVDGEISYSVVIFATPQWSTLDELAAEPMLTADATFTETLQEAWENLDTLVNIASYQIAKGDFARAYVQACLDTPDQFNVRTYWISRYDTSGSFVLQVKPYYLTTDEAEYQTMRSTYETAVNEALATVPCGATDLAKLYLLHNWVCNKTQYNHVAAAGGGKTDYEAFTSYGVMSEGSAVCQGYTLALSDLLNRAGVTNASLFVTTMNHAWNMVSVGGSWYHVDSTWDDGTPISYSYFMKSDSGISGHSGWEDSANYGWEFYMVANNTQYDSSTDYWSDEYDPTEGMDESAHTYDEGVITRKPTCGTAGIRKYTCTVCGATKTEVIAATGNHTWDAGTVTKQPTCATAGTCKYTCTVCDATKTATIAATGKHSWDSGVITKNPTVASTGAKLYTCSVCGAAKTETIAKLTKVSWTRLSGDTRLDTMQAISSAGWSSSKSVVIACASNFPDALSASALAGIHNCPILLTNTASLSTQTATEIKRLGATSAYIVGGTAAVSSTVETQLKALGCTVERLSGELRQATSRAIAAEVVQSNHDDTCIIASSNSFADALAIAPYAYANKAPIYLTESNTTLSAETLAAIKQAGFEKVVIVGGTSAVAASVQNQLRAYGITSIERLGGATRYETSALIADWCLEQGMTATNVAVASGKNFPDALAGAALCGKNNSVLVLGDDTNRSNVTGFATSQKSSIENGYVFGGPNAVGQSTWNSLPREPIHLE